MRSQLNTAKLLEGSPMLVRMRELETLEKVAGKANLTAFARQRNRAQSLYLRAEVRRFSAARRGSPASW